MGGGGTGVLWAYGCRMSYGVWPTRRALANSFVVEATGRWARCGFSVVDRKAFWRALTAVSEEDGEEEIELEDEGSVVKVHRD